MSKHRYGEVPAWLGRRVAELRVGQTEAEALLWRIVRDRQLDAKFRRQHPIAPYVLDFYCAELKLAVEIDGDQHADDAQLAHDAARSANLAERGIAVHRFSNHEVLADTLAVAETLWSACQERMVMVRGDAGRKQEGV